MVKYTAYNLVRAISLLPQNTNYNYVNSRTPGLIHIENVKLPAGPIKIRRMIQTKEKPLQEQEQRVYRLR